jgi:hypothetical protein
MTRSRSVLDVLLNGDADLRPRLLPRPRTCWFPDSPKGESDPSESVFSVVGGSVRSRVRRTAKTDALRVVRVEVLPKARTRVQGL